MFAWYEKSKAKVSEIRKEGIVGTIPDSEWGNIPIHISNVPSDKAIPVLRHGDINKFNQCGCKSCLINNFPEWDTVSSMSKSIPISAKVIKYSDF